MIKKLVELTSLPAHAQEVGLPFLLDKRTLSDGSKGWQRASTREIQPSVNAFKFVQGVQGTSASVARGYILTQIPADAKYVPVEAGLTPLDEATLPILAKYHPPYQ